jgi:hypothetical protein
MYAADASRNTPIRTDAKRSCVGASVHAQAGSDLGVRRLLRIQVKGEQKVSARLAEKASLESLVQGA